MLNLIDVPYLEADQYLPLDLRYITPPGIVGKNGNLSPGMLLSAYRQGIFPWYDDESPILWWSPEPRFVIDPEDLHVSKTMRKVLRRKDFSITVDRAFSEVIHSCACVPRKNQEGTWIVAEMEEAYKRLHSLGFAHSVEVWRGCKLIGGLYGLSLGRVFFGESMFSHQSNASKSAFILLLYGLREKEFQLFDCQVYTEHLEQLGAHEVSREEFLSRLEASVDFPTVRGKWSEWLDLEDTAARFF